MPPASVTHLIPILQTAVGPAILISGVGLLLLTMTNRLGRAIDRARLLADQLPSVAETEHKQLSVQLQILWRRARLIRLAILLASASALAAAVMILVLFFSGLWRLDSAWLIGDLFILCMVSLVLSLGVFIHDVNRSLAALRLELDGHGIRDL